MAVEPDADTVDDSDTDILATTVALAVTVVSLYGLLAASDGTGTSHVIGATVGAGIFGGLVYWIARDARSTLTGSERPF